MLSPDQLFEFRIARFLGNAHRYELYRSAPAVAPAHAHRCRILGELAMRNVSTICCSVALAAVVVLPL